MKKLWLISLIMMTGCLPFGKEEQPQADILAYEANELWGLESKDGQYLTRPKFEFIGRFQPPDDLALVKMMGLFGYIRKDGSFLLEPQYEKASDLINGKAKVYRNEIWYDLTLKPEGGMKITHLPNYKPDNTKLVALVESPASLARKAENKEGLLDSLKRLTEKTEQQKLEESTKRHLAEIERLDREGRAIAQRRMAEAQEEEGETWESLANMDGGDQGGGDGQEGAAKSQQKQPKNMMGTLKKLKSDVNRNRQETLKAANEM